MLVHTCWQNPWQFGKRALVISAEALEDAETVKHVEWNGLRAEGPATRTRLPRLHARVRSAVPAAQMEQMALRAGPSSMQSSSKLPGAFVQRPGTRTIRR